MVFKSNLVKSIATATQAFTLVASTAFADQNTPSSNPPLVEHTFDDITPSPEVHFNEHEGIKFVNPYGNMTLPPEGERATVSPSEMSPVGRLVGIDKNGEKIYLCALTAITPPEPFKIAGNGNDVAATTGHCIPSDGVESYAGDYVSYEGLFTDANGHQTLVPVESIHHNQTIQDINLSHIPDEIKETRPAMLYILSATNYEKLFDTAIVQFAEPLPESIEPIEVELNHLNNSTENNSVYYYGYPRNTRGLTTDPESIIGEVKGSFFISDAYTNVGSSGGLFAHNGKAVGVFQGGFGSGEMGEWTSGLLDKEFDESFDAVVGRIDYAGPYVNAPFLELDETSLETVSIKAGTETNLFPSADIIVPGKKPVLEDEDKQYLVLDRQNGFVGILIEDPQTRVFADTNLFYVPETTVIGGKLDSKDLNPDKPTHQPTTHHRTPGR